MSVKGSRREDNDFSKFIGVDNFKVLKFNPGKEELETILGNEIENDPTYTGKQDKEGNDMSFLNVWMSGEKSEAKFNLRFILVDKERLNREETMNQWVNQVGDFQWAKDESTLFDSFKNFTTVVDWKDSEGKISKKYRDGSKPNQITIGAPKNYRKAHIGEEEMYSFIKAWLNIDYYQEGAEISFDFDKLMKGDADELNELIGSELAGGVVAVATVRNDKNDETKQYQGISTKAFLPGKLFPYVVVGKFPNRYAKSWKTFSDSLKGEYGEKSFYSLDVIHDYNPNEDLASKKDAIQVADNSY